MKLTLPLTTLILLFAAALPSRLDAQSAGASEMAIDSTVAQQLASTGDPGSWGVTGTIGGQLQQGRTETLGFDVDLIVYRVTDGGTLIRFDAEWSRAEFRPAAGADRIEVDDTRFVSLSAVPRVVGIPVIAAASYRQDAPAELDHRAMVQLGPYIPLASGGRLSFALAPVFGAGVQNNQAVADSESILNFGILQSMTWHPTNTSTVETWVSAHRDVDVSDDYAVTANASLAAALSSHVGLKLYYKYQLEGIHDDDTDPEQHTIGAGVSITYPSR